MGTLFKRKVWVDPQGKKCAAHAPEATRQTLPCWYFRLPVNGRERWFKAYTDKGASLTLMHETVKRMARGEQGLVDQFKEHNVRSDLAAALRELERSGDAVFNVPEMPLRPILPRLKYRMWISRAAFLIFTPLGTPWPPTLAGLAYRFKPPCRLCGILISA